MSDVLPPLMGALRIGPEDELSSSSHRPHGSLAVNAYHRGSLDRGRLMVSSRPDTTVSGR